MAPILTKVRKALFAFLLAAAALATSLIARFACPERDDVLDDPTGACGAVFLILAYAMLFVGCWISPLRATLTLYKGAEWPIVRALVCSVVALIALGFVNAMAFALEHMMN